MNVSIMVTGQPRPDGSQVRSGIDIPVDIFDERAASRIVDAARQCHRSVQVAEEHQARPASDHPSADQRPSSNGFPRLATEKQVRAIHAMASRQGIDLKNQLHDRFSVSSVAALSIRQASELIDDLKGRLQSA